jgi:hypothetical protein
MLVRIVIILIGCAPAEEMVMPAADHSSNHCGSAAPGTIVSSQITRDSVVVTLLMMIVVIIILLSWGNVINIINGAACSVW